MSITVDKSANISKLEDGCPAIRLLTLDESKGRVWQDVSEPMRDKMHDTEIGCAYILDLSISPSSRLEVSGPLRLKLWNKRVGL